MESWESERVLYIGKLNPRIISTQWQVQLKLQKDIPTAGENINSYFVEISQSTAANNRDF